MTVMILAAAKKQLCEYESEAFVVGYTRLCL